MQRAILVFLMAVLGLVASGTALAQGGQKPIRYVVPLAAGSATDVLWRMLVDPLAAAHGKFVIVDNKPGADGALAAAEVIKSAPDGNTLLVGTNSPLAAVPTMRRVPPYNPITDFTHITHLGRYTSFAVVSSSLGVQSLQQLFAYAKANPGKLNSATGNTIGLMSIKLLLRQGGTAMENVAYKSEVTAVTDLLGDRVHFMVATQQASLQHIKTGKLLALATTAMRRSPVLPDVPTFTEAGMPPVQNLSFAALVGPAKMSAELTNRLSREVISVLRNKENQDKLAMQSFETSGSTPEELTAFLKSQLETWTALVKELDLQLNY